MVEKPSQITPTSSPGVKDVEKTTFDNSEAPHVEARAELRVARRAGMRWRGIARWSGLGIFAFGTLLLIYVFWQALGALSRYSNPGRLNSDFNSVAGDTIPSVIQAVVTVFGTELLRVLYLLILGYIASAIAARGIQFFAASEAVIDEAVLPEE
ncbi:hypothetical protein EON80_27960 [bacterium]|nr:MAG: hypothetical protein EON80_27960 [bacterium]